jgi:hypothetical protein
LRFSLRRSFKVFWAGFFAAFFGCCAPFIVTRSRLPLVRRHVQIRTLSIAHGLSDTARLNGLGTPCSALVNGACVDSTQMPERRWAQRRRGKHGCAPRCRTEFVLTQHKVR